MNAKLARNKKAVKTGELVLILGVFTVVILLGMGLLGGGLQIPGAPEAAPPTGAVTVTPEGEEELITATVSCPDDKQTDFNVRYKDVLQTTLTYVGNIESFAKPIGDAGLSRVTGPNTSSTGDGYAESVNALVCRVDNPVNYQPEALTQEYGVSDNDRGHLSAMHAPFVSQGPDIFISYEGAATDRLRAAIEDNKAGVNEELNNTAVNSLGFGAIEGTTTYTTTDGAGMNIGVGEEIDVKIRLKTNRTNRVFGDDNFGWDMSGVFKERTSDEERLMSVVMSSEVSSTDYDDDGPVVSRSRGDMLEILIGDLLEEDSKVLSAFDFFHVMEPFDDREDQMNYVLDAADSSTNPSTDVDLRFCALSRYDSLEEADTTRVSCFDDSASNAEVAYPSANTIRLDVQ